MKKLGAVACLLLFTSACGGTSKIVTPTTTQVPTTTTTAATPTTTASPTTTAAPTTTTSVIPHPLSSIMEPLVIDVVVEVQVGRRIYARNFQDLGNYGHSGTFNPWILVRPYIEDAKEFNAAYIATSEGGEYQDTNCRITNYSVTITDEGSCIVFVYLLENEDEVPDDINGTIYSKTWHHNVSKIADLRIFDFKGIKGIPSTTTTFDPAPSEWEYISSAESGACIEGFVVRDEPQTNPPESYLKYEILPLGDQTDLYLHVLGCDGIDQIKSIPATSSLEVEISTEIPYTEGGKFLETKWISTDGFEWKHRDFSWQAGVTVTFETWLDHFFVLRSSSEPELKYAETCPSTAQVKDWTVESHQVAGWTVNVDCHIPEGLRVLWVEEFEKDLAYIAEIIPQTALPYARDVKYWVLSPGLYKGQGADYVTGVGLSTPREIIGGIRMASGQGPPSTMQNPEERRAAYALHELAHAWDYMIYPEKQRTPGGQCTAEEWFPGQTYGESPGMVNCRAETPVTDAYFAAREAGIYEQVETLGSVEDSYALSNHDEYFGVLTQAYFWTSYFYPFNREQLVEHDPVGAVAVEAAWNMIPDS